MGVAGPGRLSSHVVRAAGPAKRKVATRPAIARDSSSGELRPVLPAGHLTHAVREDPDESQTRLTRIDLDPQHCRESHGIWTPLPAGR